MTERIPKSRALRVARSALPIRGNRVLQENLEFAAPTLAEAYRLGAREAQHAIVDRIAALRGTP
jgi:hypothetical protein